MVGNLNSLYKTLGDADQLIALNLITLRLETLCFNKTLQSDFFNYKLHRDSNSCFLYFLMTHCQYTYIYIYINI